MSAGHILLIAFAITLLNGGQAAPLSTTAQITGSYRKDFYLEHYHEQGTVPPTAGGRVHITVTNTTCQEPIKSAQINGQDMVNLPNDEDIDFTYFDWARVHVDKSTRVAWLSFHSRNKDWLDGSSPSLKVSISDATGSCFDGSVTVNSQAP